MGAAAANRPPPTPPSRQVDDDDRCERIRTEPAGLGSRFAAISNPKPSFPNDRLSGVTTDQLESVGTSVEDGRPLPHFIDAARSVSLFGFGFCAGLFGSAR